MLQHGFSKNQNILCKIPGSTDRAVLIEHYYVTVYLYFSIVPIISFKVISFFFQSGIQARIIHSVSCHFALISFKLSQSPAFYGGVVVLHSNVDIFEKFSSVALQNVLHFGFVGLFPHD